MSTTEVVIRYYAAVCAGDWETWFDLLDENLIMDEQLMGHVEGSASLSEFGAGVRKGFQKFLMHPQHVVVQDDEAAVIWRLEAVMANGTEINAKGANYFKVKDNKIVYMANFHDTVPFKPLTG
jgi:ketosteroid isomerase-like protein